MEFETLKSFKALLVTVLPVERRYAMELEALKSFKALCYDLDREVSNHVTDELIKYDYYLSYHRPMPSGITNRARTIIISQGINKLSHETPQITICGITINLMQNDDARRECDKYYILSTFNEKDITEKDDIVVSNWLRSVARTMAYRNQQLFRIENLMTIVLNRDENNKISLTCSFDTQFRSYLKYVMETK